MREVPRNVDVVKDISRTLALAKCTVIQSFFTDLGFAAEGETVDILDRLKSHFSRVGINRVQKNSILKIYLFIRPTLITICDALMYLQDLFIWYWYFLYVHYVNSFFSVTTANIC